MHHARGDFDDGEDAPGKDVDDDRDQNDRPHEQGSLPPCRLVVRMGEHCHAFDFGADEVRGDADEGTPGKDLEQVRRGGRLERKIRTVTHPVYGHCRLVTEFDGRNEEERLTLEETDEAAIAWGQHVTPVILGPGRGVSVDAIVVSHTRSRESTQREVVHTLKPVRPVKWQWQGFPVH